MIQFKSAHPARKTLELNCIRFVVIANVCISSTFQLTEKTQVTVTTGHNSEMIPIRKNKAKSFSTEATQNRKNSHNNKKKPPLLPTVQITIK